MICQFYSLALLVAPQPVVDTAKAYENTPAAHASIQIPPGRYVCRHWTSTGVFRIEWKVLAGAMCVELWFKDAILGTDTNLGPYCHPVTAAGSVSLGKHDKTLGFKASRLGVPSSMDEWNGYR